MSDRIVYVCGCGWLTKDPPPNEEWFSTDIGNHGECLFCNQPIRAINIDHLERIKAQAIIDTREYVIGGSYLGERTAMMDLLGMDEVGNIKEGE